VKTCWQCGATLADNAQYCMQCGTAADEAGPETEPATPVSTTGFLGPALISGSAMGILATIPLVNCLCCAWFLGGGALSAWLVGKKQSGGIRTLSLGDGAFAGVLAGVWGAVVATVASIPVRMLSAASIAQARDQIETMLAQNPEVPNWVRELLLNIVSQDLNAVSLMVGLFINLLLYGLFAMVGGIVLVAIMRRKSAESRF
jgi:zinc-ribbon domain